MNGISGARALALVLSVVWPAIEGCGSSSNLGPPPLVVDKPAGWKWRSADWCRRHAAGQRSPGDRHPRWGVRVGGVRQLDSDGRIGGPRASATTGADGISATTWTLGAVAATQTAQAAVSGATNSPVSFTATATPVESPPSPPPVSPLVLAQAPTGSGDGQTGPVGIPLGQPLRVIVTRGGTPQSGVTIAWNTGDGSLDPASNMTGGDGIASSSWTLGPIADSQSATAAVTGANGSPVTFIATATAITPPPPPSATATATERWAGNSREHLLRERAQRNHEPGGRYCRRQRHGDVDLEVHGDGQAQRRVNRFAELYEQRGSDRKRANTFIHVHPRGYVYLRLRDPRFEHDRPHRGEVNASERLDREERAHMKRVSTGGVGLSVILLVGCGSSGEPNPPPLVVDKTTTESGDHRPARPALRSPTISG